MREEYRKERGWVRFEKEKTHLEDLVLTATNSQKGPEGGPQFRPITTKSPTIAVWSAGMSVPFRESCALAQDNIIR